MGNFLLRSLFPKSDKLVRDCALEFGLRWQYVNWRGTDRNCCKTTNILHEDGVVCLCNTTLCNNSSFVEKLLGGKGINSFDNCTYHGANSAGEIELCVWSKIVFIFLVCSFLSKISSSEKSEQYESRHRFPTI